MTTKALEERLTVFETRLDTLQRLFEESIAKPVQTEKHGWQTIIGKFENDPLYDEAMRLGREWRESQFDEIEEKTR